MTRQGDVVIVSRQRLVGRTNGSSAYLMDLVAGAKAAGFRCVLVQPSDSIFGRIPVLRLRPEMAAFSDILVRGALRFGNVLVALSPKIWASAVAGVLAKRALRTGLHFKWLKDRRAPYSIAMPWSSTDRVFAARHIPNGSIVVADYVFQTEAFGLPGVKPRATAVVMHDLFHLRAEMVAAVGATDSVVSVSKDDEVEMLGRADLVIAIQQTEADFVRFNLPDQAVITVPISFSAVDKAQHGADGEVLFVGSNTEPNVMGLKWFCENCWPAIVAAVPQATLLVAGTVARGMADFPVANSVKYLGIVDDLGPLYGRAGVVISPLRFGSGLKVKLIEALALGKAVVATSVTLQGVESTCESAVEKADDPNDFALAVARLLKRPDLRTELGTRAVAVAKEHFSSAAAQRELLNWLTTRS